MNKKESESKKIEIFIVLLMFVVLLISTASAGILEWLKETITGKASTTQYTNVSISVTGVNPVYFTVWNDTLAGTVVDPTEEGTSFIIFNVTVHDDDGANDINSSSVMAEFTNDTITRNNLSCSENTGESTATSRNFTCGIDMWYFDVPNMWMINVTANDLGNASYISNYTQFFNYNQLQAIVISSTALTWPSVSPGATNQTSNNDPTEINNTGNYNATGNLQVEAINLYGSNGEFIAVENFTVGLDTGGDACSGATCTECAGTNLANGSSTSITGAVLEIGNLTAAVAHSNETIFYCAREIPLIMSSQTYSTQNAGSSAWIVRIV